MYLYTGLYIFLYNQFFLHIFSNITFLTAYLCVQSYRKFVKEYILFDNNVLEAILEILIPEAVARRCSLTFKR